MKLLESRRRRVFFEIVDCLDVPNKPGSVHYIPHREVICEDKDTTNFKSAERTGASFISTS